MNKTELIKTVADKTHLTQVQSAEALKTILETITDALSSGDTVQLPGFGTFLTRERAARKGVNPRTHESLDIPAVTVPAFKAGSQFKAAVRT